MTRKIVLDLITYDGQSKEYVLYLVEEGPWNLPSVKSRLRKLQERLYNAVDAVIDGALAKRFPESMRAHIRIQVDIYGNAPKECYDLVERFAQHIIDDVEYRSAILASPNVSALRVLLGKTSKESDATSP